MVSVSSILCLLGKKSPAKAVSSLVKLYKKSNILISEIIDT